MNKPKTTVVASLALASLCVTSGVEAQQQPAQQAAPQLPQAPNMTFFVTSVGPGKGADLGGVEGADQYCQQLAQRHGAGGKTWRAYLSTQAVNGSSLSFWYTQAYSRRTQGRTASVLRPSRRTHRATGRGEERAFSILAASSSFVLLFPILFMSRLA